MATGNWPLTAGHLVLVGGAPGAGKTTLARRLAQDLGQPLLAKDEIKEALYDTLGAPDRAASQRIGAATYAVVYLLAERLLAAGVSPIIESNFRRGVSEPELRSLTAQTPTVLIHCQAPRDIILARYAERAASGERHPGHHDHDAAAALAANLAAGHFEPLDLAIPTLVVDTINGYAPAYEAIVRFAAGSP